jgi:hypothetical protein
MQFYIWSRTTNELCQRVPVSGTCCALEYTSTTSIGILVQACLYRILVPCTRTGTGTLEGTNSYRTVRTDRVVAKSVLLYKYRYRYL